MQMITFSRMLAFKYLVKRLTCYDFEDSFGTYTLQLVCNLKLEVVNVEAYQIDLINVYSNSLFKQNFFFF